MDEITYLTCPRCGDPIREPFAVGSGPHVFVHRRSHRAACRLVVVRITTRHDYVIDVVPDGVSVETVLARRVRDQKVA